MTIIDLSHTIKPGMPVYPGTEPPQFEIPVSIETNGYLETKLTLFSHTGTHVDAPAHMLPDAQTLDQMKISDFSGSGLVIDISRSGQAVIKREMLIPYEKKLSAADFVLLYSGWSNFWGDDRYFENYPVLEKDAAQWICQFGLKGIGIDMISVDTVESRDMPVHKTIFGRSMIIIENLTNLEALLNKKFTFHCFPLKISNADGAPTRATAIL